MLPKKTIKELAQEVKSNPQWNWHKLDKSGMQERDQILKSFTPKNSSELRIINALSQMKADSKKKYNY